MFVLHQTQANYCASSFPSSSCQTEFSGQMECALQLKGSLSKGLRRNSSNLSQLSSHDLCAADATQIEFDVSSLTSKVFELVIETPTGEQGLLQFNQSGSARVFTPNQNGCGHGRWTLRVYQLNDEGRSEVASERIQLDGVGTLFFTIDDELIPRLSGQEFLFMSGLCPKHRH